MWSTFSVVSTRSGSGYSGGTAVVDIVLVRDLVRRLVLLLLLLVIVRNRQLLLLLWIRLERRVRNVCTAVEGIGSNRFDNSRSSWNKGRHRRRLVVEGVVVALSLRRGDERI